MVKFPSMPHNNKTSLKGKIVNCKIIDKITKGKVDFFLVDAGLKKEALMKIDEDTRQFNINDEVKLFISENDLLCSDAIMLNYNTSILMQKVEELKGLKKQKKPVLVSPLNSKNKKEVVWQSTIGPLQGMCSTILKESKPVIIVKVTNNSFFCMEKRQLKVGAVVNCKVVSVTPFFIFVSIFGFGSMEGLIAGSEGKNLEVDQEIQASVLHIEGTKVTLGISALQRIEKENKIFSFLKQIINIEQNNIVEGVVKSSDSNGISVLCGNKIEGFCHINDLSWSKNNTNILSVNQKARFLVKECEFTLIDREGNKYTTSDIIDCHDYKSFQLLEEKGRDCIIKDKRTYQIKKWNDSKLLSTLDLKIESMKLKLSYKDNLPNPYLEFEESHKKNDLITVTISYINVDKEEIEGITEHKEYELHCLLTINEINWNLYQSKSKFNAIKVGDKIQAAVRSVDPKIGIIISLKKIEEDLFLKNKNKLKKNETYNCIVTRIITENISGMKSVKGAKVSFLDKALEAVHGFIPKKEFGREKLSEGMEFKAKLIIITGREIVLSKKAADDAKDNKILESLNESDGESYLTDLV